MNFSVSGGLCFVCKKMGSVVADFCTDGDFSHDIQLEFSLVESYESRMHNSGRTGTFTSRDRWLCPACAIDLFQGIIVKLKVEEPETGHLPVPEERRQIEV